MEHKQKSFFTIFNNCSRERDDSRESKIFNQPTLMKARLRREPDEMGMKKKIIKQNESTDDINFCSNEHSGRARRVFSTTLCLLMLFVKSQQPLLYLEPLNIHLPPDGTGARRL